VIKGTNLKKQQNVEHTTVILILVLALHVRYWIVKSRSRT